MSPLKRHAAHEAAILCEGSMIYATTLAQRIEAHAERFGDAELLEEIEDHREGTHRRIDRLNKLMDIIDP